MQELKVLCNGEEFKTQNGWVARVDRFGNIISHQVIKCNEEIDIVKKKRSLTDSQIELLDASKELKEYSKSLGGYINMCYVRNELLFNKVNIERSNISRLIYLSTFIDYNDKQENLLVKKSRFNSNTPLTKRDIRQLLNISDNSFRMFMKDVIDNELLYIVEEKFYINPQYFNRGKISGSNFKSKEYTRIFINTTRFLYENCTPRQHKQLSYTFQLTPLIHYETNILCKNPGEVDSSKIEKLTLKDICLFLGVSTSKASMSRLEKDIYKLFITIDDRKYYMFKRVIVKGGEGTNDYFIVNPKIIWGGKDIDIAKETMEKLIFIENIN